MSPVLKTKDAFGSAAILVTSLMWVALPSQPPPARLSPYARKLKLVPSPTGGVPGAASAASPPPPPLQAATAARTTSVMWKKRCITVLRSVFIGADVDRAVQRPQDREEVPRHQRGREAGVDGRARGLQRQRRAA